MPKIKLKKNDTVLVLSGRDEGKKAKILKVDTRKGTVLVEGVNVVKKHTKPKPPQVPQGGILEKALPIPASRVMLVCPQCSTPTRIKFKLTESGSKTIKQRICGKCQEVV